MPVTPHLDLAPLKPEDIPDPNEPEFQEFLDKHFALGQELAEGMHRWPKHSTKVDGTVQIVNLTNASSVSDIRKSLGVKDHWCGRISHHTPESVNALLKPHMTHSNSFNPVNAARNMTRRLSRRTSHNFGKGQNGHIEPEHKNEVERQAHVMKTKPRGLYERFRRGLLEYHSENEREYIEACRETECLHVYQPHVAEVWRLTYVTPPPTNPRTFVVLLLSRELKTEPQGERCFMNISLPFLHPSCVEKQGEEKSRVRGKYVSVEQVKEMDDGAQVEWKMSTSSDAGGNIPRFMVNSSLPGKISEDVPSFLNWMVHRFPEEGEVATGPVEPGSAIQ